MRLSIKLAIAVFLTSIFLLPAHPTAQERKENLDVLDRWARHSDNQNALVRHLNEQAYRHLYRRDEMVASLETREDWLKRQAEIQEKFLDMIGPLPKKTPLNPRVMETVDKDGYKIEKIIYESMPGFHVTGCLFVPDGIRGKTPAILNAIGHSPQSFRRASYQVLIHNLVKKKFIVFAIDPLGQGERLQYYDPVKGETVKGPGNPTVEHSYCGDQCFISGNSLARYWTWDCVRAIDYLLTREEVDPARIGMTGCSGGGTQTAFTSAVDRRIKAAAPSCYLTSAEKLLEFVGPQDADHNYHRGISDGVTAAELHVLRAPLPTLLVATTRDYYSIQGARETYREVMRAYASLGAEGNLRMAEDDSEHGLTQKNNEAIYAFFQEILDNPGSPQQEELPILPEEALNVTPTGQLSTFLGGETVFSINKKETVTVIDALESSRKNPTRHLEAVGEKAQSLSGYIAPAPGPEPVYRGRYRRDGYTIEKWALYGEGDYMVPLLLFVPSGVKKYPAIIYLNPEGKAADAEPGGRIEKLVKRGLIVAAADLIGVGETATRPSRRAREIAAYTALLIGRSIPGLQAGDAVRVADFLKKREEVDWTKSGAVAFGELCPALLHAAVFDQSMGRLALVAPTVSYRSVVNTRFYEFDFFNAVTEVLTAYDLPDLIGYLAPRKLLVTRIRNGAGKRANKSLITEEMAFPRSIYRGKNAADNLKIVESIPIYEVGKVIDWWLE
ncbi:acetylxylan esterase [candidate division KSB1 bacterium]